MSMTRTVAISGKGGSGKTTVAAMIVRLLREQGAGPILAVDADANSCLGLTLGVEPAGTIAEIRDDARAKSSINAGTDKLRAFEYGIQQVITEASGFDLLTMGRPEGPACYCAVNNLLRQFLDKLSSQYQFVIIDNEAGMEHLSRRTTNNVDLLYIVTEATSLGVVTAKRIFALAKQLPIVVKEAGVVWNKVEGAAGCEPRLDDVETLGRVPIDQSVLDASIQGRTIFDLDPSSLALLAVRRMTEQKIMARF
jgi:CO dehydrogenase maturation factor